jgi:hypothetical protein
MLGEPCDFCGLQEATVDYAGMLYCACADCARQLREEIAELAELEGAADGGPGRRDLSDMEEERYYWD